MRRKDATVAATSAPCVAHVISALLVTPNLRIYRLTSRLVYLCLLTLLTWVVVSAAAAYSLPWLPLACAWRTRTLPLLGISHATAAHNKNDDELLSLRALEVD